MRSMKKTCALFGAVLFAATGYAQESLLGKYSGSSTVADGGRSLTRGAVLTITSVENGVVKANYTVASRRCSGEIPMEGTLREDKLHLASVAQGGRAGDCSRTLNLIVKDNTLVGRDIQLSK